METMILGPDGTTDYTHTIAQVIDAMYRDLNARTDDENVYTLVVAWDDQTSNAMGTTDSIQSELADYWPMNRGTRGYWESTAGEVIAPDVALCDVLGQLE